MVFAWCKVFFFLFTYQMRTHLLVKTHPFEIKLGYLRDLCTSNEFLVVGDTFYITISTNSPLPAFSQTLLNADVFACMLWFRITKLFIYMFLQC